MDQQESKTRRCSQCQEILPLRNIFCPICGTRVQSASVENTQTQQQEVVSIFIFYVHQDKSLQEKLRSHLLPLEYGGLIKMWHKQEVLAGQHVTERITTQLDQAHIILLLISAFFMDSDNYTGTEMMRALERHKQGEADIILILVRPVLIYGPPLEQLSKLPKSGKAINAWSNKDSAFVQVAEEIKHIAQEKQTRQRQSNAPDVAYSAPIATIATGRVVVGSLPQIAPSLQPTRQRPQFSRLRYVGAFGLLSGLMFLLWTYHATFLLFLQKYPTPALVGFLAFFGLVNIVIRIIGRQRKRLQQERERIFREKMEARRQEFRRQEENQQQALHRQEEARNQSYYWAAIQTYQAVIKKNPIDDLAYTELGNAYIEVGNYSEAEVAFTKALRLTPEQAACFVGLGDLYAKRMLFNQAVKAYEKALEIDPTYASSYAHLYDFFMQRGMPEQAREVLQRAKQYGYEIEDE